MIKWFWIILGSASTLGGLLVLWSPLPLGLPLLLIGIPLLMKYSPRSRTTITRITDRFPVLRWALQRLNNPAEKPPDVSSANNDKHPLPTIRDARARLRALPGWNRFWANASPLNRFGARPTCSNPARGFPRDRKPMSYNGLVEEFRKIDVWHDCCNNSDEAQMKPTCQPESTAMNSQFNYATFVELFLKTDDEHAPSALSQCPAADLTEKIAEPGLDNPISPPA